MYLEELKISILYDNRKIKEGPVPGWGFSAFLNLPERDVLFDAGADRMILEQNLKEMSIDQREQDLIFLSHPHSDHTGGLSSVLNENTEVRLLSDFPESLKNHIRASESELEIRDRGGKIGPGLFTTGKMTGEIWGERVFEQSLALSTSQGTVLITGCAHPGVEKIIAKTKEVTGEKIHLVLGGLHLKNKDEEQIKDTLDRIEPQIEKIAPCHCSGDKAIKLIEKRFEERFVPAGVGKKIKI